MAAEKLSGRKEQESMVLRLYLLPVLRPNDNFINFKLMLEYLTNSYLTQPNLRKRGQ